MRPSAAARATLLAVALSYGSQDVALRLVLTLTAAPSPPAVALVKALIQAAAFAPPYFLSQREGTAPPWSVSLGLAAALVASNEFLLEGIKRTSAAKAAFLLQLSVVFTPILEYFVLRRRQGARVWLGALCACVGCAFLTSSPDDSFVIIQQRTGDLLVVAAATAWAAYIVLTAAIPPDAGALEVQARKNLACAGFYALSGNQISGADSLVDFHTASTAPAGPRLRPSRPRAPGRRALYWSSPTAPWSQERSRTCCNKEPRPRSTPPRRRSCCRRSRSGRRSSRRRCSARASRRASAAAGP